MIDHDVTTICWVHRVVTSLVTGVVNSYYALFKYYPKFSGHVTTIQFWLNMRLNSPVLICCLVIFSLFFILFQLILVTYFSLSLLKDFDNFKLKLPTSLRYILFGWQTTAPEAVVMRQRYDEKNLLLSIVVFSSYSTDLAPFNAHMTLKTSVPKAIKIQWFPNVALWCEF